MAPRLSGGVPSPQSTAMAVTFVELETVKETVTVAPVLAGLGVGGFTLTIGTATGATETGFDAVAVCPPESVAVTVTV